MDKTEEVRSGQVNIRSLFVNINFNNQILTSIIINNNFNNK